MTTTITPTDAAHYDGTDYNTVGFEADGYDRTGYDAPHYQPYLAPKAASTNDEPKLDLARYTVGAAVTAVIAALAGLIGLVLIRSILHIPVDLVHHSTLTPVGATGYAVAAAGAVLLAGLLFAGLLHAAPHPRAYFSGLVFLATALAGLLPFTTNEALRSQFAFGGMNIVIGLIIGIFIPLAAITARSTSSARN
jgi:Family of unknown function (DUF6069)